MEIHQLQYVVEVAKQGSFTRAADEICVSQSTLSHQIAKLEDELGVKLFTRQARSVSLTQAGEDFIKHVKASLNNLEFAKQSIEAYIGLLKGTLKIGLVASLGSIDFAGIIENFYREHAGINFQITQAGTYSLLEQLHAGILDVAFIVLPETSEYEDISFHQLAYDDYVLVVPAGHPAAKNQSIDLASVAKENFIFHPASDRMHHICMKACETAGFKPNIVCVSNHSPTSLSLISAGMGIGFFPREKVAEKNDRIAILKLKTPIQKNIGLAIAKQASPAPAVKAFHRFVLKWVADLGLKKD